MSDQTKQPIADVSHCPGYEGVQAILVTVPNATVAELRAEAKRYGVPFPDVVRSRLMQAPLANTLAVAQNPSAN